MNTQTVIPAAQRGPVRIALASAEEIRSWSSGAVLKSETINYRTRRPEKDGLFCERIFGPQKDWECACGKYRGMKHRETVCERCGVRVAHSRVRRKRMGHIDLAAPVVHTWFLHAAPSRLGAVLGMRASHLERVVYFQDYVVLDPGTTDLERGQILTETEYQEARARPGSDLEAGMGAESVRQLLGTVDLVELSAELRQELAATREKSPRRQELIRRLQTVEALRDSGNEPGWLVLDCIPVIPPDLRPLVPLDNGSYATSDLNDLYRRILNRNNRLKKLIDLNAPEVIVRNEKRMLQQSVDALFDNNRCKRPVLSSSNRPLKSLTDMIKGKEGRFRENLLGKRVDYSARSVIVVGPELKLHQCGLPKKIALELFQPFIIHRLKEQGHAPTIRNARNLLRRPDERVWSALEAVMKHHPVLLNRAPTLHRMGIQAFEPVLTEGEAIRLHPLVCKGFNADFDGDTMAVHLPLSIEAQAEASVLLMSTNNIFSPANGQPIISPSQDVVMGCYYLTWTPEEDKATDVPVFSNPAEVLLAHAHQKVAVHDRIEVRLPPGKQVVRESGPDGCSARPVATTVGRVLFNDVLAARMPFYDLTLSRKHLARVVADCHRLLGRGATIRLLDRLKELGFRAATRSGLSFATADLGTVGDKERILARADKEVEKVRRWYEKGLLSTGERDRRLIDVWTAARDEITRSLLGGLARGHRDQDVNPLHVMVDSGARGSAEQLRQLGGMRGLMARPSGEVLPTPIRSSFREGLNVLEYFCSTHGARKGLVDAALKTAQAGHLTRKLVDVAQNVIVSRHDCGTSQGILKDVAATRGRVSCATLTGPRNEVLVEAGTPITPEQVAALERLGTKEVRVRSPLTCAAPRGVCRLCYGLDLSTGALAEEGLAVGVIAAQSLGEPGTQLLLRNFHLGGVHNAQDIALGLPRLVELFEAYRPRTAGTPDPHEVLRQGGVEAVRDYLVKEVQAVYRSQSVDVDDKHIEIVVAQMLRKVKVEDPGDTGLLPGAVMDRLAFQAANDRVTERGGVRATARVQLLGVTRAAVQSDSFIAAASFQETTRVLTEAALAGKVDPLLGLKENVILGRLIPAGTGFTAGR
jgi:DNA-directed RNA polymerase subunit beta'